jgi:hypothetical protein
MMKEDAQTDNERRLILVNKFFYYVLMNFLDDTVLGNCQWGMKIEATNMLWESIKEVL